MRLFPSYSSSCSRYFRACSQMQTRSGRQQQLLAAEGMQATPKPQHSTGKAANVLQGFVSLQLESGSHRSAICRPSTACAGRSVCGCLHVTSMMAPVSPLLLQTGAINTWRGQWAWCCPAAEALFDRRSRRQQMLNKGWTPARSAALSSPSAPAVTKCSSPHWAGCAHVSWPPVPGAV